MSDCTCVLLRYGDHLQPAEWEQNPLCREHPDAEYALDEIERLEGENADLRSRTSSTLPAAVKAAASALIGRIDRGVPAVGLESCVEVVARWCLDERAEP